MNGSRLIAGCFRFVFGSRYAESSRSKFGVSAYSRINTVLPELSSSEMWKIEDHPPLVCHPVFQHKRHPLACNWHYPVCRSQQMSHFLLQRPQVQRLFPLSSSRMGDIKQHPPLLSYPVYSRKHPLKVCTQHYPVCKPRQMSNLVLQLKLPLQ